MGSVRRDRRQLVARCVRTKTRSLGRLKPVELQGKHKERKKMHKIKENVMCHAVEGLRGASLYGSETRDTRANE